jgi:hypothetical protein
VQNVVNCGVILGIHNFMIILGGGGEIPLSFKRNANLVIALFDWPITKIIYHKEKKTPQFSPIKRKEKTNVAKENLNFVNEKRKITQFSKVKETNPRPPPPGLPLLRTSLRGYRVGG